MQQTGCKEAIIINTSKKRSKRKYVIITILALAAIVALLLLWHVMSEKKVSYITAPVELINMEDEVSVSGLLKPSYLVAIGARTTGKILSVNVHPGDNVKKGQLLVEIDSTNQQNSLNRAKAELAATQAKIEQQKYQLNLSRQKLERSKILIQDKVITNAALKEIQAEFDMNKAVLSNLEALQAQAQLDIENAKLALSYTHIQAPQDGTILATLVQAGQNINAVQSAPSVVILGNLDVMKVYVQISEADVEKIKVGDPVDFTIVGNPQKIYHAKLEQLEPAPETIRQDINFNASASTFNNGAVYYNGIFEVANPDHKLRTYMSCEAHIILAQKQQVLAIPATALNDIDGNHAKVRVKQADKVSWRNVTTGLNNKVMVEITSGLRLGEEVVVSSSKDEDEDKKELKDPMRPPHKIRRM